MVLPKRMNPGSAKPEVLLDPETVRALDRLRLELRRRISGSLAGRNRSTRYGASVEFAEHRAYAPGDDPRRIDWNVYSRLGELVVRLFVAEQDVTLHLLVDASRSMADGAPSKLHRARRFAAALGYLCLTGSERVSLTVTANESTVSTDVLRGRQRVGELFTRLDRVEADGGAALDRAVESVLRGAGKRPGVVVVFSDFFDTFTQGPTALLKLCAARHETIAVHLLSRGELSPGLEGEVEFIDVETRETVELSLDEDTLESYHQRLGAWTTELEHTLRRGGARYVKAFGDRPELDVLTEALGARTQRRQWTF